MYRRVEEYTQHYFYNNFDEYGNYINNQTFTESKRFYNVFYGGLLLGTQVFVNQLFTIDLNFGGGLRLVKIDGEEGFTKYKNLPSLDYSGVVPRASIIIGIIHN
ncbi:MAG: hypothetical protein H0X62_15845 [Bacteroidetes bacterium]|nr:hypothetical protein [Bacteroidota bacterium]